MLNIYLCEDDPQQRQYYATVIADILQKTTDEETKLFQTDNPHDILRVAKRPLLNKEQRLYFLDIHLAADIDGMQLASAIRQIDTVSEIVFLTTDTEQMPVAFRLQLKALDYILKDQSETVLIDAFSRCIEKLQGNTTPSKPLFQIRVGRQQIRYPFEEVMFICTNGKKGILELHTRQACEEFRGTIRELLAQYPLLLQIHQGIVINPDNVIRMDDHQRFLTLRNGEKCEISYRYRRKVLAKLSA